MNLLTRLGLATAGLVLAACSQPLVSEDSADSVTSAASTEISNPAFVDFTLSDLEGNEHTLSDYLADGKTVVLEWFNPGCPVTRRYHTPNRRMAATYESIASDDLVWLAINSGGPGKQGHGLEANATAHADWDVLYPILIDESGEVGRAYGAATTPHMYVLTPDGTIAYQGGIDDSNGRGEPQLNYVEAALADLRAGRPVEHAMTKPFGCSVKYASN